MIAHISTTGDPSVGIWGISTEVELQLEPRDDEERENIRQALADAFGDIYGEPARIQFHDELQTEQAYEDELARQIEEAERRWREGA